MLHLSPFALWLIVIPAVLLGLYSIWPMLFGIPTEPAGHAISHAFPAVVTGLVAIGIWRTRAARRRGERLGLAALAVMSAAQALETVSAFTEYPSSGTLHDTTSVVSMLAVLGLFVGIVWALAEAVRHRDVPAWVVFLVFALLAVVLARMVIGF